MPNGKGDLDVRQEGQIRLVAFTQRKILEDVQIQQIGERLSELVDEDPNPQILLDFNNVEHLSSAALSVLIALNRQVEGSGGRLVLANIQPQIFEVFRITRLNRIFNIQGTREEAIKAFD